MENNNSSGLVIAGFVLSILSLLFGAIPFIGWLLLITATIFVIISYKRSEKKGLSIASLVMVILTWIYKVIIVVSLIGAVSTLDGLEKELSDTKVEENGSGSEKAVEKAADKVFNLNEVVSIDGFDVTVTNFESKKTIGVDYFSKDVSEGGTFIAVQYKIKNTGNEPASFYKQPSISLIDENGVEYAADIDASSYYAIESDVNNEKILSDLNPGITVTGSSVFEVSEELFEQGKWFISIDEEEKVLIK